MMNAICTLSDERLITTRGTIIPQAVRFGDGRILVRYSLGNDAWFTPCGAHVSADNGQSWEQTDWPLNGTSAMGVIGPGHALFFDQYLWKVGDSEYAAFYAETQNSGETFSEPKLARFHLDEVVDYVYTPRPHDDPDYFYEPDVPQCYRAIQEEHGTIIGGHMFGPVLRLPDGALGLSAYVKLAGNMTRPRRPSSYVVARSDDGVAPEAGHEVLDSSVFFRSEDEGATWRHASTIGSVRPDRPFDAGQVYSEGLNETGMSCTSDGKVYALMRHGSYMLLWWAVSEDGGRSWGEIQPLNYPGVAPCVTLMPNGMLAAAWGRPGLTVGFSLDGTGQSWDVLVGVMDDRHHSQKYPWIVPIAENRLMLFHDRRKWDQENRQFYDHGIYCRELTIECK